MGSPHIFSCLSILTLTFSANAFAQNQFTSPALGGFKVDERAAAIEKAEEEAEKELREKKWKEAQEQRKREKVELLKARRGTRICSQFTNNGLSNEGNIEEIANPNIKILSNEGKYFWDSVDRWRVCH